MEVSVVIVILVIVAAVFLPVLMKPKRTHGRISCANNLKQIWLSSRIWAADNRDLFPMQVSVADGGAMELAATGNVAAVFQVMSNELNSPRVLSCPDDAQHPGTASFTNLNATNISYFVGLDIGTNFSWNRLFCGDANLTILDKPVNSGVFALASNAPVKWDTSRKYQHRDLGYLCTADGSVAEIKRFELTTWLTNTGLATNRLAIP